MYGIRAEQFDADAGHEQLPLIAALQVIGGAAFVAFASLASCQSLNGSPLNCAEILRALHYPPIALASEHSTPRHAAPLCGHPPAPDRGLAPEL